MLAAHNINNMLVLINKFKQLINRKCKTHAQRTNKLSFRRTRLASREMSRWRILANANFQQNEMEAFRCLGKLSGHLSPIPISIRQNAETC